MSGPHRVFDLSRAKVCVILNDGSGRKAGDAIVAQLAQLAPKTAGLEIRRTKRGQDLLGMARAAVAEGFDVIAAAGGDGTQAAVASAVTGSQAIMAVLPGGTFNYFARDLGVGETTEAALKTLTHAQVRQVHVGQIGETVFLNNVSLGAYPEILKRRESIYSRWGRSRIAAYGSALLAIWGLRHPMHLEVTVQGERRQFVTALAFVAKSAYQLEAFGLEGGDAIRDGHLVLMVARARRPGRLLLAALRLALGRSARYADFDMIIADEMQLGCYPDRQLVAHDGEKTRMRAPFHLRVLQDDLSVLVPAEPKEDA